MTDMLDGTATELVSVRRTVLDIPDTAAQLELAREQATAVTKIIDAEKLSMRIGRSDHVLFEGWATLGAFNGISVHTVWSRPVDGGWEARCEARTVDGRVVGTAEAMCTRTERNWAKSEDYAIRSMAQTRAGSKALKGPLSWVMVLAGKSGTPAEEMDEQGATPADAQVVGELPSWAQPFEDVSAVAGWIVDILKGAGNDEAAEQTAKVGQAIFDEASGTIPRIVATTIAHLHRVIAPAADATEQPEPTPTNGDTP